MDFVKELRQSARALEACVGQERSIADAAGIMISSVRSGGCVFWCGNGGSAADAQHLAAELVGRYRVDRAAIRSIALTTDTSILTAVGNDSAFEAVFERQVQAIGRAGDVLVAISTSGQSKNVLRAVEYANHLELVTIALLGASRESPVARAASLSIHVPSTNTAHVQTAHITIGQMLCGAIEEASLSWS